MQSDRRDLYMHMEERLLAQPAWRKSAKRGVFVLLLMVLGSIGGGLPMDATAQLGDQRIRHDQWHADYEARADSIIDHFVHRIPSNDISRGGFFDVAARLYRGTDLDWALTRLDTLMQNPRGDMFWMYPMILVQYVGRDILPESYQDRLRNMWRTYTPYRGDTENHWAMYYTALYLISELYPDDPPESWFNGRSSQENLREAREYLISWMDLTTTNGQGEFDSPTYMNFFLAPMAELYAFAEDPEMRQRARMMLDYLLADFAAENLHGLYAGGHSRIYPEPLLDRRANNTTAFAWLVFGNTNFYPRGEAMILAVSGYEPPVMLRHIATDRSRPYVHRELKRTRHRIRYTDVKNAPVYKTTYMSDDYAVSSIQGGLLQPIQQHTWEVLWTPTADRADINEEQAGHNMLFTVHPYSSSYELAMYFPEEPELITQAVTRSKSTYDSGDKWTSGSPYEKVFQEEDAVIVLYDIPEGTRFPHISGFFSRELSRREEHESGWIFARGGNALIAYYPLAPYEWQQEQSGDWRLFSDELQNGAVVQVAPASEYASFDAFRDAVLRLELETATEPVPSARFTSLDGKALSFTYGEAPTVDGEPIDYSDWPLFDGPFMHAEAGSRRLELRYGPMRRLLDFDALTVRDWLEPAQPSTR